MTVTGRHRSTLATSLPDQPVVECAQPVARAWHWVALAGYSLLGALWGWFAGRDLNWDQLNHHLYISYNFVGDRLHGDFMAAQAQGYLNAIGYLPFYALVIHGYGSATITLVLGALHAVNLWALHAIGWVLFGPCAGRFALTVAGALLGGLCPIFLIEAGSSFNEPFASAAQLAALWATLRVVAGSARPMHWLWAGAALSGIAVGIKLTSALFALINCVMLAIAAPKSTRRLTVLITLVVGAAAGFALIHGYWGWRLWQVHGSALFPVLNSVLGSPDYIRAPIEHLRFVPESWRELLARPFLMAWPRYRVYVEALLPDVRPAAALGLGLLACVGLARRGSRREHAANMPRAAWIYFAVYCAIGGVLWLKVSGNGRYGLGLLLLLGVAVTGLLARLLAPRRALFACAVIAGIQAILFVARVDGHRFMPVAHARTWFDVSVPSEYAERPHAFVLTTLQSYSFVAPFVHPSSRFVDIGGDLPIDEHGPGGARAASIIRSGLEPVTLLKIDSVDRNGLPLTSNLVEPRVVLGRFGLDIDANSCLPLADIGEPPSVGSATSGDTFGARAVDARNLLVCKLVPGPTTPLVPALVRAAFTRIEQQCPRLFGPVGPVINTRDAGSDKPVWWRDYANSDTRLTLNGQIFSITSLREPKPRPIGSLSGGLDRPGVRCIDGRRLSHAEAPAAPEQ